MNEELNQMQGNDGGTATPNAQVESANLNENQNQQPTGEEIVKEATPEEKPTDTFTQEQVNELIKKRIDRVYSHYGVKNKQELDEIVGKSKSYDVMKDRYGDLQVEHAKLQKEMSFMKNNIDEARYDDIDAYFKGKGLEFNNDALVNELATHPEWLKKHEQPTTLTTIGSMHQNRPHIETADEKMKRVFGI